MAAESVDYTGDQNGCVQENAQDNLLEKLPVFTHQKFFVEPERKEY